MKEKLQQLAKLKEAISSVLSLLIHRKFKELV